MLNIAVTLPAFRAAIAESPTFSEFVFAQLQTVNHPSVETNEAIRIAAAIVNNSSAGNKISCIKMLRAVFNVRMVQALRPVFPERIGPADEKLALAAAKHISEALRDCANPW